jgi:hypothetical protein
MVFRHFYRICNFYFFEKLEEDVKNESFRVKSLNLSKPASIREPLVVKELRKIFKKNAKPFSAVGGLSFGVLPTDCFGLLGTNLIVYIFEYF